MNISPVDTDERIIADKETMNSTTRTSSIMTENIGAKLYYNSPPEQRRVEPSSFRTPFLPAQRLGEIPRAKHSLPMIEEGSVATTGIPLFPWQLHDALNDAERSGFAHVVSWDQEGHSFRIHDRATFTSYILPKYFHGQKQYKSFQRQCKCGRGGSELLS
jgi:hypothetical protein